MRRPDRTIWIGFGIVLAAYALGWVVLATNPPWTGTAATVTASPLPSWPDDTAARERALLVPSRGMHRLPVMSVLPIPKHQKQHLSKPSPKPTYHPRPKPVGLAAWLADPETRHIRSCESHDNYTDMSRHNGVIYYGAWQANAGFWTTYGGDPKYLSDRSLFTAPRSMQDEVAYRGWLSRGYSPWACH